MVQGISQLQKRLVDLIPKAARAGLESAMLASADMIVAGAKLRAPIETGNVHDSIRHHGVKVGKKGGLYIAITAGDDSTETTAEGKQYQVARLLEFGTVDMPAQPFMLTAYRANRRKAITLMRKAVVTAIRQQG